MLQLLGILFICLIAWIMITNFSHSSLKANLRLAIGFASERGVPQNFSVRVIENLFKNMNIHRELMAKEDHNFKNLPTHEQYGIVLVNMYNDKSPIMELVKKTIDENNSPSTKIGRTVRRWDDEWHLQHIHGQRYELKHNVVGKGWLSHKMFSATNDDDACNKCAQLMQEPPSRW